MSLFTDKRIDEKTTATIEIVVLQRTIIRELIPLVCVKYPLLFNAIA